MSIEGSSGTVRGTSPVAEEAIKLRLKLFCPHIEIIVGRPGGLNE